MASWRCPDCGMTSPSKVHQEHKRTRCLEKYNQLSQTDASWLASALDFDGSLTLCRRKLSNSNHEGWLPLFQLGSICSLLVERCCKVVGGGHICQSLIGAKGNYPMWHYGLNSNGLRTILPQILPFVVAKREQVILMIEALDNLNGNRGIGHYSANNPRLEEIQQKIKQLNEVM